MAQFSVNAARVDPYKNFKFRVKWDGRYVAGVSKVGALKRTNEPVVHRSGGDPSTTNKSPGPTKYEAITLERGVTHDIDFEQWANKVWNFGSGLGVEVSLQDFARFGYLFLRDGVWDGERILPEGWVDYSRTPTPQTSEGFYGAHFWIIPGSLGLFYCSGMGGQRILISPKLDLIVVRVGKTAPHKVGAVVRYCKELVDAFRPTAT